MKKVNPDYFLNPKSHIPKGSYCYNANGICPFWDKDNTKDEQENGYCHFLKRGDWDMNAEGGRMIDVKTGEVIELDYYSIGGLLWDQVKECGVNDDDILDSDEELYMIHETLKGKSGWLMSNEIYSQFEIEEAGFQMEELLKERKISLI